MKKTEFVEAIFTEAEHAQQQFLIEHRLGQYVYCPDSLDDISEEEFNARMLAYLDKSLASPHVVFSVLVPNVALTETIGGIKSKDVFLLYNLLREHLQHLLTDDAFGKRVKNHFKSATLKQCKAYLESHRATLDGIVKLGNNSYGYSGAKNTHEEPTFKDNKYIAGLPEGSKVRVVTEVKL